MRTSGPRSVDLACERWYVLALRALARRDRNEPALASLGERLAAVEHERARTAGADDPIARLADRLGLAPTAATFLAATVAFTLDPRLAPHADALGGPVARRGLSVAVLTELAGLDPADARALVVELGGASPLVAAGLVTVADDTVAPAARPYRAAQRVLAHVQGDDTCDPELTVVAPDPAWIHDAAQAAAIAELARVLAAARPTTLVIEGPRGAGRRSAVACALGRPVVVLDAERVPRGGLERALVALRREALLRDAVPVIADGDALVREDGGRHPLAAFVEAQPGPLALTATRAGLDVSVDRPVVRVRWPVPDAAGRRRLWGHYGGEAGAPPAGDLDLLAFRYRVGAGAIARAVDSARTLTPGRALDTDLLGAGLRHNIAEKMGGVAQRIEVTQRWDDVVLADDTLDQIHALIARVRHGHQVLEQWGYRGKIARGTGVAALFSGPPGTGKTMVSGLIARELDLELYQVDLSQVVSKWVGETEKQLARVFDAAEEGHALLLFDEADALFGQRSTEVKSAVDRYANLEVNFLLQRIEAFGGITVLTTNLDASIDRALKRRLAAHIVFAVPDEDERAQLWQRLITTGAAPIDPGVDVDELARGFPTMTGANIRNAALSAAFLAAAAGSPTITHEHLARAARAEYRSMGHVLAEQGRKGLGGSVR